MNIPKDVQGESLLPLAEERAETPPWRDALYYAYFEEGEHAVPRREGGRGERFKLAWFPGTEEWQLFDLESDPHDLVAAGTVISAMALFLLAVGHVRTTRSWT